MIYSPLKLLSDVLLKQAEIEEDILLNQNMNRAMELWHDSYSGLKGYPPQSRLVSAIHRSVI